MFTQPKTCPNTECGSTGKFFIEKVKVAIGANTYMPLARR